MGQTIICRIIPTDSPQSSGGAGKIVTLEIHPASGAVWRLTVAQSQSLKLQYGDKIKAVSGTAGVLINPGTPSGMFILSPQIKPGDAWNFRTELEINDENVKHINRGKISTAADIGTILRGTGAVTR